MPQKLKTKHLNTVRKQVWLYDAICAILWEDGEMNAWNVTKKLREAHGHKMTVNDKTVRLYLDDLVKQKRVKRIEIAGHTYYQYRKK